MRISFLIVKYHDYSGQIYASPSEYSLFPIRRYPNIISPDNIIMLATLIFALLSLSATPLARELDWPGKWDQHHKSTINYTTISGFFLQDDPTTDPKTFDYVRSLANS